MAEIVKPSKLIAMRLTPKDQRRIQRLTRKWKAKEMSAVIRKALQLAEAVA